MKRNDVLKCSVCGNMVECLHVGGGELICCEKPMEILVENTQEDVALEKHVPIIERIDAGYRVKVGEVEHPMLEKHYIQWIELISDNEIKRVYLDPNQTPEAIFSCSKAKKIFAREYCNLHGLWRSK